MPFRFESKRPKLACCAAALLLVGVLLAPLSARAQAKDCPVTHDQLTQALKQSVKPAGGPTNGGLDNNEWAAVINRKGVVCAITFSGEKPGDQWPGSRAIAIEKANTVNNFGLDNFAVSTANLWAPTQPGASLYGLAASVPPVGRELVMGEVSKYGTTSDPILGKRPGGTVLFGGGLALYNGSGIVGGLGLSGDTSCADHNVAWRVREKLKLDKVPNGPSPAHNDEIVYDVGRDGESASGWGHPECGRNAAAIAKQIGSGVVETAAAAPGSQQQPQSGGSTRPSPQGTQGTKTLPRFER